MRAWSGPIREAIRGAVVVAEDPVGPGAGGEGGFVALDEGGQGLGGPVFEEEELEVEGELGFVVVGAVVGDEAVDGEVELADEDAVAGVGV